MKTDVLVSVVIPTFNRAHLLGEAITSVTNQNYNNLEIIIVDDRSQDETREIVDVFHQDDKRIRYLINSHTQGPSGARNCGIKAAHGDFIAFLDSDDIWEHYHISRCIDLFKEHPLLGWIFTDLKRVYNNKISEELKKDDRCYLDRINYRIYNNLYIFDDPKILEKAVLCNLCATPQTSVVRRNIFKTILFDEDIRIGEDRLIIFDALLQKIEVGYLDEVHCIYRIHENNSSGCNPNNTKEQELKIKLELDKYWKKLQYKFIVLESARLDKCVRRMRAEDLFWGIGYNLYARENSWADALQYFWAAIRIYPYDYRYWKTIFLALLKNSFC